MPPEKLLSCPFCSAIARPHDGDFSINHTNECFFTQQYAQEMWIVSNSRRHQWNTRTPSPELVELRKDKERLDWLDKNKVGVNKLCNRDEIIDYWHLYWTPKGQHCNHSGHQDAALGDLRTAIDAAMKDNNPQNLSQPT